MVRSTSNGKKKGSIDNKTAVIKVEEPGGDVRVFEAKHYIRNSDDGTISIYEGPRSDGIDFQAHVERCTIDRVDTHDDTDDERRTDGHTDDDEWLHEEDMMVALPEVSAGDTIDVTAHREQGLGSVTFSRNVTDVEDREILFDDASISLTTVPPRLIDDDSDRIGPVNAVKVSRDVSDDCMPGGEVGEIPEDPILPLSVPDQDDGDVIGPGDYVIHEYPAANVPDLWQVTGVHHYNRVNVDGIPDGEPAPLNDVPAHTVYDLRTQDGEHHTAAVHEDHVERAQTRAMDIIIEDEDDDQEIVTDGGRELVSGDDVRHAGERWRVARSDGARVEIYQLGGASLIVPIDTVETVPEVRA